MYLGVPEVLSFGPTTGQGLNLFGMFRGYRANSDPTGKTRATETGTWRVVASGYYFGNTTTGQNSMTYHLSLAALFQRVA